MIAKSQSKVPSSAAAASWLLFVHQLPPRPAYLRVKIWRQLRESGAIALKNALYVLPATAPARAAFQEILLQIEQSGGTGAICEAEFIAGMDGSEIRGQFNSARDADYQALAKPLRAWANRRGKNREVELNLKLQKLRQQLARIAKIDFFGAGGRVAVEALLAQLEHSPIARTEAPAKPEMPPFTGRLWVTRQDVHVDRIASAWLIRRFIDPRAKFKFVLARNYRHGRGELRFDMADAEFTHEGDKCSFEVLLEKNGVSDPALTAIAEIIHNLDLKDRKFDRPETSGIGHIIEGICASQDDDMARITRGSAMLDDMYARFRRGKRVKGGRQNGPQ